MPPGNFDLVRSFVIVLTLLVLQEKYFMVSVGAFSFNSGVCRESRRFMSSRYISYQEVYTYRKFFFKHQRTRVNFRWEHFLDWKIVSTCCPGYKPQGIETSTCFPSCPSGCQNGKCIKPYVCDCNPGYRMVATDASRCVPHCMDDGPEGCGNHGSCVAPNTCVCHNGYNLTMRYTNGILTSALPCIPECKTQCGNNSFCLLPNKCTCNIGYTPIKTERRYDDHFNCEPSCNPECGINMNCYAPNECKCDDGYQSSSSTDAHLILIGDGLDICTPVCDPPCINGTCTRPFHCECHNGYENKLEGLPHLCSPVCNPECNSNAYCDSPNNCLCNTGYTVATVNSSSVKTVTYQQTIGESDFNFNETNCKPVCEPDCKENESCVAPNSCQCNLGYRPDVKDSNLTQCLPICEPSCVNAYCGYPNECICHPGYTSSLIKRFVCDPVCQDGCFNATCVLPNHCECHNGYEKKLEDLPHLCSPVCNPGCNSNAYCASPNNCLCNTGYTVTTVNSSSVATDNPLQAIDKSAFDFNETSCKPVCESDCKENESCVEPNSCQCDLGYRPDVKDANLTQCLPICEPSCVNAYCGYPNECICLPGYTSSFIKRFVCDPVCQDGCFNATCVLPNHCECYDGYEKALIPTESHEGQAIFGNTCIPTCPGQCRNGTCIAPGQCLCDPGYVLNGTLRTVTSDKTTIDYAEDINNATTINDTFIQFCQPFCEPGCPTGSECLAPNECEPEPRYNHDYNEFSINSTDVINSTEDCGKNGDFLDENGRCICKYGWTGWRCEESSLCGLIIKSSKDNEKSTTLESISVLRNGTIEPTYDDFNDERMISSDDESGILIDWQGPMCMEECRILMTSPEISGNRSDKTVNCYLLESENATTGVSTIRDRVLLPGSRNGTLLCFISIGSKCNSSKLVKAVGPFETLISGIIGAIIVLALVTIVGLTFYYRKNRLIEPSPAASKRNSTMLIYSGSTCFLHTPEESSTL